ncbi:MAG: replication-associated recombination protein A [Elusimicrobia bacterium]|nr:replication-associated recombination protein A [Elusimicrobiota bacterium]
MDLFEKDIKKDLSRLPLAARMSPRALEEFVGQEQILGKGKLLRRVIELDKTGSLILFGPPGCGKSALAKVIANQTGGFFQEINAVISGVEELRKISKQAEQRWIISAQKTILLVDELHHFNRTQQDALLPDVEKGNLVLIGITTENPYFYVNAALVSRSQVFEFKRLREEDLTFILEKARQDEERGFGRLAIKIEEEAMNHLIKIANGDARKMLNALELAVLSTPPDKKGFISIDLATAEESIQKKAIVYDKKDDQHYDTISAFIKSMRGSDPDATLYWLAKMIYGGEDPRFIARRIAICAAEDVGNADPLAIIVANSVFQIVELVGMPEGRIPLAQAAVYVACAPKSNANYLGIDQALGEIEKGELLEVPDHLKDANLDREQLGHGQGYQYPHDFPGGYVAQEYLPKKKKYYQPKDIGFEKKIKERLDALAHGKDKK